MKPKDRRTRRYRARAPAPDPKLHSLLLSHYRLSSTAKVITENMARAAALIDAATTT